LKNKVSVRISNFAHGTLQSNFFPFRFEFLTLEIFERFFDKKFTNMQETVLAVPLIYHRERETEENVTDSAPSRNTNVAMVTQVEWWIDEINLKVNIQK
jgi:hypothetical protein